MHPPHRWYPVSVPCLLLVLLAGCGGSKEVASPAAVALSLTVVGTPDLNSTEGSTAGNAAYVHFYQLGGEANFRSVTPEMFWQDAAAALGQELVAPPQQLLLYPGQTASLNITPVENAQFIGVAADLRQPDLEQWRQVYALEALRGRQVTVRVGKDRVTVNLE